MSDYTPVQLIVYDCPPEEREAICEIIESEGYGIDYFGGHDFETLLFDQAYGDDEASLTAPEDVGNEIIARAPGSTFVIWSDPKYEYLGSIVMYAPDLGPFTADCDSDGNAVFTAAKIISLVGEHFRDDSPPGSRDEFKRALGVPWGERMDQLRATLRKDISQIPVAVDA